MNSFVDTKMPKLNTRERVIGGVRQVEVDLPGDGFASHVPVRGVERTLWCLNGKVSVEMTDYSVELDEGGCCAVPKLQSALVEALDGPTTYLLLTRLDDHDLAL